MEVAGHFTEDSISSEEVEDIFAFEQMLAEVKDTRSFVHFENTGVFG